MIVYVDTSVLIKLLIEEVGSAPASAIWDAADSLSTSRLTYVEARAALAAAHRAKRISQPAWRESRGALDDLWAQLFVVEVTEDLVNDAAPLAEEARLRGYDAVHLASALLVRAEVMASADDELCAAANAAGTHVANPNA